MPDTATFRATLPPITWTSEERMLGDLREWDRNPRQLSKHDADMIAISIGKFNLADPLVINADGQIIGGHQRKRVMLDNGYKVNDFIDVRVPSRQLTEKEAEELNIRLNRNSGEWDFDVLANEFELGELLEWGFKPYEFGGAGDIDYDEIWRGMPEFEQEDQLAWQTIKVHLSCIEDRQAFSELMSQAITGETKYIWYPKQEKQSTSALVYADES